MKTLHTIDNFSLCTDERYDDHAIFICSTCGETVSQTNETGTLSQTLFSFAIAMFAMTHHNCKRKKNIQIGMPVTDLTCSYLGKVKKIDRKNKTVLVKDTYKYKKIHKLSEILQLK